MTRTDHEILVTGHDQLITGHGNLFTGHDNTITGHKTADQPCSWTGHDQLVISFSRPEFYESLRFL